MDRTVYINIGGREYPMRCTLGASRRISEKFGGFNQIIERIDGMQDDERLNMFVEILEILIAQGCGYKNNFEADLPVPDNAPVKNGRWVPVSAEQIETGVDIADSDILMDKITECINAGQKKTIGTESKEPKNAEAM